MQSDGRMWPQSGPKLDSPRTKRGKTWTNVGQNADKTRPNHITPLENMRIFAGV